MDHSDKTHYFYVLFCADRTFYAGYTTDLKRREEEHNTGIGAKYTRPDYRRPLRMIYAEAYQTRSEAMKREAAFKKLSRPEKENYLKTHHVKWNKKSDLVIDLCPDDTF